MQTPIANSANYDQGFVRRSADGWRMLGTKSICDSCGDRGICSVPQGLRYLAAAKSVDTKVTSCAVYVPVISFQDQTGLDGTCNTFRRGLGWQRRLVVGQRIGLLNLATNERLRDVRVAEVHGGKLGTLLDDHAAMNHMLRGGNYPDAAARLMNILIKLYGRNHAALDAEFSVVYMEKIDGRGAGSEG